MPTFAHENNGDIRHPVCNRTPMVSIGLPVYNGAAFLGAALDSLLGQSFEDFELIISDNASTDRTEAICREYAARDQRIRYHRQKENHGAIWNFNHVFGLSHGKFFKWAAYDDVCRSTFLAQCVHLLNNDPSTVWCHSQSGKIDSVGQELKYDGVGPKGHPRLAHSTANGHPRRHYRSLSPHRRFRGVLLGTNWCVDCYGLFRRQTLSRTRMLLPPYGAEKILIGEVSLIGRYQEIPETLFYTRVHTQNAERSHSSAEQHNFMDPKARQRLTFTRLQLLRGHVGSVLRTDLSAVERVLCLAVILQYLLQVGKWPTVVRRTLRGQGVGD
ncbi:MAG: glycosyltransferase family 2 protein [Gammaproteobacteria bacterium]